MNQILIALAALAASIATPSFAQTSMSPTGNVVSGHTGVMLADHTMRASKLIGSAVYGDNGEAVGKVDDVVVTAGAVEPTVVVLVSGAYLGGADKLTTEPLSHLKLGTGDKMMMSGTNKASLAAKKPFLYTNTWLNGGGG